MAFFNTKTKLSVAASERSELNLSHSHPTTSNFMELGVAEAMELVPKSSIEYSHRLFSRLEPMLVPTLGNATIYNKAFFVPYRTVFPGFVDFDNDTEHVYADGTTGFVTQVPCINNEILLQLLLSFDCALQRSEYSANADITVYDGAEFKSYDFKPQGKLYKKIFEQLGYKVNPDLTDDSDHSALPLLCLLKVYLDWYFPSQYVGLDVYRDVEKFLKLDYEYAFTDNFDLSDLQRIMQIISYVYYDNDLFVCSWDNPNGPNIGTSSDISIANVDSPGNVAASYGGHFDTSYTGPVGHTEGNQFSQRFSQFTLTALKSLTDYMKRHQIVGARALDRYLSRWGISLDSDKLNRSYYLGGSKQEIKFGDVTSQSDTEGARLGYYAGQGISYGDGNYKFDCQEFGHFFILSTIIPEKIYYQGADPSTQRLTKLDFYTPEFDNLGSEALPTTQVLVPSDAKVAFGGDSDHYIPWREMVFGFVPRYATYKVGRDKITGDYALNSMSVSEKPWTMARDLIPVMEGGIGRKLDEFKHDLSFISSSDRDQFNRLFYAENRLKDQFNIHHSFKVKCSFPGSSLYDSYKFENEDESKKITVDVGTTKTN